PRTANQASDRHRVAWREAMMRRKIMLGAALVSTFALGGLTAWVFVRGDKPLADKWRDHCALVRSAFEAGAYALRQERYTWHRDFVGAHLLTDDAPAYHRMEDAMECGDQDIVRQSLDARTCRAERDFGCLERVALDVARSIDESP